MNALEPLQLVERNHVRWRGRKLVYFSGCDYFRLASHPAVLKAAADGLKKFGLNVAASRLTTGHHRIYDELESALANFFNAPSAVLLPGGYSTSTVVAQALAGEFAFALIDERAHPALQDAAMHLGCRVTKFKHRAAADLKRFVQPLSGRKIIVLTDGMFSHNGSAAPLKAYLKVLPRTAQLLVDDAHGAGVLGPNGQGTLEHEGVARRRIIQCVTLSKAFGVYGGAVLGAVALREKILARSRAFIGCTPLPLPQANAALKSVMLLQRDDRMRVRLHRNAETVKVALRRAGFEIPPMPGPIVAVHPASVAEVQRLKRQLLSVGIYPPFLRYAGVERGFFRFVISSEHTAQQLSLLASTLTKVRGSLESRS
ncbi:MAG: hypothetical protein RLY20_1909 [Verrucomicrobiota bacterium]|jgi:7-keto-8-aminopelargonate synthetase-like enzyme